METGSEFPEEALLSFLQPDESMKDFLLRTFVDPLRTSLEFVDEAGIQPGNVVEVCGASGSGKTEVLMQVRVRDPADDSQCALSFALSAGMLRAVLSEVW